MEYYSTRKKEMMSFEGKWMKLAIIMLSKARQFQKTKVACIFSYVEDRYKR
jgi:hypothetical protein